MQAGLPNIQLTWRVCNLVTTISDSVDYSQLNWLLIETFKYSNLIFTIQQKNINNEKAFVVSSCICMPRGVTIFAECAQEEQDKMMAEAWTQAQGKSIDLMILPACD